MFDAIKALRKNYPSAHFMIIGHSLGAAISTIAALET